MFKTHKGIRVVGLDVSPSQREQFFRIGGESDGVMFLENGKRKPLANISRLIWYPPIAFANTLQGTADRAACLRQEVWTLLDAGSEVVRSSLKGGVS